MTELISSSNHITKLKETIYHFLDFQQENYRQTGFFVCLSGGIDSSTMLKLLVDRYGSQNVIGFTTVLDGFNNPVDIEDAKELCQNLGVTHIVKNITEVYDAFLKTVPELQTIPRDNIASRIRIGMACEFSVTYNSRLVFAAPYTDWILSGSPIGCDSAHCYPFAGLYKAEILALAQDIGLPQKFLTKKPSNSAVEGMKVDKTTMYKGIPLSQIDKIVAHIKGLIPREGIKIDDSLLVYFNFLLRLYEPDIDIRGLESSHDLNTQQRKDFLQNITTFPFEK